MHEKFFENDFAETMVDEVEFVRSPFYELAKATRLGPEKAEDLMDTIYMKNAIQTDRKLLGLTAGPHTRETVAYTRYADVSLAEDDTKYVF